MFKREYQFHQSEKIRDTDTSRQDTDSRENKDMNCKPEFIFLKDRMASR